MLYIHPLSINAVNFWVNPSTSKTTPNLIKVENKPFATLNFTDLGSPFGGPNEDPPGTPTMSGEPHLGPPTPHDSSNSTPVSKSAFIELQQHGYGPLRTTYPHHFNSPAGNAHGGPPSAHDTGFHSPRSALGAYPFPPMHQNSYTGYHLGSYASNCPPSPKDDGKLRNYFQNFEHFPARLLLIIYKRVHIEKKTY